MLENMFPYISSKDKDKGKRKDKDKDKDKGKDKDKETHLVVVSAGCDVRLKACAALR